MRGVIWYQGEDNYNRASTYADMFSALIRGWREEWQQGLLTDPGVEYPRSPPG